MHDGDDSSYDAHGAACVDSPYMTRFVFPDGVVLEANNAVIRNMSNVFAAMLESNMVEARTGVVHVQECGSKCFRRLLAWAHDVFHQTEKGEKDKDSVEDPGAPLALQLQLQHVRLHGLDGRELWDMADIYDVRAMRTLLLNTVSHSNVCAAMQHALQASHSAHDLFEACIRAAAVEGCLRAASACSLRGISASVVKHMLHAHRHGGAYGTEALAFVMAWCDANSIAFAGTDEQQQAFGGSAARIGIAHEDKDSCSLKHKAAHAWSTGAAHNLPSIDAEYKHVHAPLDSIAPRHEEDEIACLVHEAAQLTSTAMLLCMASKIPEAARRVREILHERSTGGDTWGRLCDFAHERDGGVRVACRDASFCADVATLPDGAFVVVDWLQFAVHVYSANLRYERQIGSRGPAFDQYAYPFAAAATCMGHVVVSDQWRHRVLVYTRIGAFLAATDASTQLLRSPTGVAVGDDDGLVYVCDAGNLRVQVFDVSGAYVRGFEADPCGEDRFRRMKSIVAGSLYVAVSCSDAFAQGGGCVALYTTRGALVRVIATGTQAVPSSLCMTRAADLVVADPQARRLLFFDQFGTRLREIGADDLDDNAGVGRPFSSPNGVALGRDGSLFVAEFFDSCVKILRPACVKARA
jgi:hypothetical protein